MNETTPPEAGVFRHYVRTLLAYARFGALPVMALMIFLGLTEGVGLLMLIPLLQLIGLDDAGAPGGVVGLVARVWNTIGLNPDLPSVLCVYAGVVSFYALLQRCSSILNAEMVQGFTHLLRNQLYEALARADWPTFVRTKSSDVSHVLTVNLNMVGFGTQQLAQLVGTGFVAAVHCCLALTLSVPLTMLALACATGLLFLLRPLNAHAHRSGEDLQKTRSAMYQAMTEYLNGMKTAKSYGAGDDHMERFSALSDNVASQVVRFARVASATRMYNQLGTTAALAVSFYVAVRIISIPATDLIIMVFIFARLVPKVSAMQQSWQRISNMLPSYSAALEMLKRFEAAAEPPVPSTVAPIALEKQAEFRRVSFRYDENGEVDALQEVDLVIPAGSFTAIVGPSGAGKTTLADLLMGLLVPYSGQVLIDGRPLTGETLHAWRASTAYVPQETFLFHDTLRANLLWARHDAEEKELWYALKKAAADRFVSSLPKGLDTVVRDRGMRLSGGERQRIALARALLRKPTLLLLDEATSVLDLENERKIQEAVEKLRGNLTIVAIAHRPATIRTADRIVVLNHGRVAQTGTWEELTCSPQGRFKAMGLMEEPSPAP